jgi:hypothetical protein
MRCGAPPASSSRSLPEEDSLTIDAERRERRLRTRRRIRRRRVAGGVALLAAGALTASAFALRDSHRAQRAGGSTGTTTGTTTSRCEEPKVARADLPAWYRRRRATVLVDSVLLGGVDALRARMPKWRFEVVGHPAIMVKALDEQLRSSGQRVAPLVIVGVGYNSLWERDRRHYRLWAAEFDRRARQLLATLRHEGAQQFVWVTLRHARRAVIPSNSLWQFDKYAWYFGYVNERLSMLDHEHDDLVRANWASVSNKPGLTYDAIHLNPRGGALMARTIRTAVDHEARRQARAAGSARAGC